MGHGVGLSQTGAQNLAKLGWTTDKILQFYYPGTELQALNEKIKR
jgi:SpoIID/LytB domain protein